MLREDHPQVNDDISTRFPGRSGKNHAVDLTDRQTARWAGHCSLKNNKVK
jgi:hypothetical protein